MNSTSNFDVPSKEVVLSVKGVNLFFDLDSYGQKTLREEFISFTNGPYQYLTKKKKQLHALKELNLKIYKGDRVGIVGVNGAGKTSFCRCVAGMYLPQTGLIRANGKVRAIFDIGTGVMPELTGRENVYLLARLFFPEVENLKPLVEEILDFSELGSFVDIPFKTYSKGMQTRLLLSTVSSRPCDLLILDEVFDGADVFFQKKMASRILGVIHRSGAVMFVSHTFEQLRMACNRLIVLNENEIAYDGPVEEGIAYYSRIGG